MTLKITDTHCHPTLIIDFEQEKFQTYVSHETIILSAQKKYVEKIFCISTEKADFTVIRAICQRYQQYYFSLGIHPCDAITHLLSDIDFLEDNIQNALSIKEKIIGIGEIGIDRYHDVSSSALDVQVDIFERQLNLAVKYNLPVIIHSRKAFSETITILKKYAGKIKGVVHAFGGDLNEAYAYLDLGFYIGIGGIVTYPKNKHLCEIIKSVGITSILLETDAPFLPTQSMRGKINYPKYCYDIGVFIANYLEIAKEIFFENIENNVNKLFFNT